MDSLIDRKLKAGANFDCCSWVHSRERGGGRIAMATRKLLHLLLAYISATAIQELAADRFCMQEHLAGAVQAICSFQTTVAHTCCGS